MRTLLADARRGHPGLYWLAAGMAALALVTAGLAVVDQRTLVGAPLWFKPLKFSISIALFALALAWMLGQLRERAMRRTGWAIVAGLALEMVIIVGQAARGQKSHYNTDGGLGSVLFSIMGATITVVWFLTLAIAAAVPARARSGPGDDARDPARPPGVAGRDGGRVPARAERRPRRRRARRRPRPVLRRLEHDGRRPAHLPLRRPARPPGAAAAGGAPGAPLGRRGHAHADRVVGRRSATSGSCCC